MRPRARSSNGQNPVKLAGNWAAGETFCEILDGVGSIVGRRCLIGDNYSTFFIVKLYHFFKRSKLVNSLIS